jgi:hypothetical protein
VLLGAAAAVPADPAERGKMPHCMSFERYDRLARRLEAHPPFITPARLPQGMHIGRCLFEMNGKRLISGACAYRKTKTDLEIDGPHQIYSGIDYPDCFVGAQAFSTDYFVNVSWSADERLDDGARGPGWQASWNETPAGNYAQAALGTVVHRGHCYSNARTRICMWPK